eukprot:4932764-Amphidinium_carterae.1
MVSYVQEHLWRGGCRRSFGCVALKPKNYHHIPLYNEDTSARTRASHPRPIIMHAYRMSVPAGLHTRGNENAVDNTKESSGGGISYVLCAPENCHGTGSRPALQLSRSRTHQTLLPR